jgi:hypothetical protein
MPGLRTRPDVEVVALHGWRAQEVVGAVLHSVDSGRWEEVR